MNRCEVLVEVIYPKKSSLVLYDLFNDEYLFENFDKIRLSFGISIFVRTKSKIVMHHSGFCFYGDNLDQLRENFKKVYKILKLDKFALLYKNDTNEKIRELAAIKLKDFSKTDIRFFLREEDEEGKIPNNFSNELENNNLL